MATATKYEGTGVAISNLQTRQPPSTRSPFFSAAATTLYSSLTLMDAAQVNRCEGMSKQGKSARFAQHWPVA